MDISFIFDNCIEADGISDEDLNILDTLLNIQSPMSFTDDMISDDDIDRIKDLMTRLDARFPCQDSFCSVLQSLPPSRSNSKVFI